MRVLAHGVDLVDCLRLREAIDQHGQRFLQRVFTPAELAYCLGKKRETEHLAGRFAAKEAVFKALGAADRDGATWREVEVRRAENGAVEVTLSGRLGRLAAGSGVGRVRLSLSHTRDLAGAAVVLEGKPDSPEP
jgi:holo-[acyl-carrier protein] synthase